MLDKLLSAKRSLGTSFGLVVAQSSGPHDRARGVTVVTDLPIDREYFLNSPDRLDEVLQEGAMYTPTNGGARPPEDVVVDTRYIYTCSRSCGFRAGNQRDPIFDDRFLKALTSREAACLLQ
jgi:hypothetical protein